MLACPTNLFGVSLFLFVSVSAYIGAMLCLSVCCVCLRGCTICVSIIFPSRVFVCLIVRFHLPE